MNAIKLKENVYWVGAVDADLRLFHGYSTGRGSTYNAYLVVDKEITLIDTVKITFYGEMLDRIKSIIDPSKIDNIILNHVEPDHSGSIEEIKKLCPNAKIYASFPSGVNGIKNYYDTITEVLPIKTNDTISTGKYNFSFVQTPMLHWPDNMVCYLNEHKILFSNDAFGQHYATYKILDTENDINDIMFEAKKYYANIVLPFAAQVKKALKDVAPLDIEMIAPSHGVVLTKHIKKIINLYDNIVNCKNNKKAVIVYDTMWHNTEKMARAIAESFLRQNIDVKVMSLQSNHISDVITEIADCQYIAVGSPTINNNMLPTVASFLCYLKGLAPQDKQFIAFGSYGWGGQSIKQIHDTLLECKFTPASDMIRIQYKPTKEALEKIQDTKL